MKIFKLKTWLISIFFLASMQMQAQDYLVSFAVAGAEENPEIIEIENLDQGTSLTINGDDVLHLLSNPVGISDLSIKNETLNIYPNPMVDMATLNFYNPHSGNVSIQVLDITGKTILHQSKNLPAGNLSYKITGLGHGTYLVNIESQSAGNSRNSAVLISQNTCKGIASIELQNNQGERTSFSEIKSTTVEPGAEIQMQYFEGETLKFTAHYEDMTAIDERIITESQTIAFAFAETLTDIEGNVYPTVTIGNQTWMAENLKTTKYNDGTDIPYIVSEWDWTSATTPGYCWFDHDQVYADTNDMGAMYNWFVVETGNLCPEGWHVPSRDEFQEFVFFLAANGYNYDGSIYTGNNIDEAGEKVGKSLAVTSGWLAPTYGEPWAIGKDQHLNNSAGFNGVGGSGRYMMTGVFGDLGYLCNWWTSTATGENAWTFFMYTEETMVIETYYWKQGGYNVRCVKDE